MYLTLFVDRSHLLTQMILKPGHVAPRLKSKLQNDRYEIAMSSMQWILSLLCIFLIFFFPLSSTRNVTVLTTSNTAGDLKQTGTYNHSRAFVFVLCVWFVDRCLSFCTFSFGHCVVCSSWIYGFWLSLWCLQILLLRSELLILLAVYVVRFVGLRLVPCAQCSMYL
jgi:hypothetical protein